MDGLFTQSSVTKSHIAPSVCGDLVSRILASSCVGENTTVVDEIMAKIFHSVTVPAVLDTRSLDLATSTLQSISQRYPKSFEAALQSALNPSFVSSKYALDDARRLELRKFIQSTFSATPHKLQYVSEVTSSDLGLFLALENPSLAIRVEALSKFASSIPLENCTIENPSMDLVELGRAVLRCVTDTSFDVCRAACTTDIFSRLGALLPSDEVFGAFMQAHKYWITQYSFAAKASCEILESLLPAMASNDMLPKLVQMHEPQLLLLNVQTLQLVQYSAERLSDHHRELILAALKFAEALGKAGVTLLSSFKKPKSMMGKEENAATARDTVISLIADAMASKITKKTLQSSITVLHKCLVLADDKNRPSIVLRLLLEVGTVMVNKSPTSVETQVILTLALCWVHNTHNIAHEKLVIKSLHLASKAFLPSNICVGSFHLPVERSLGLMVLQSLLASGSPASASAVALCLQTFFSSSILPVLCNLSFLPENSVSSSFITVADESHEIFFADCETEILPVSPPAPRIRTGALHTLAAYLSSALSQKSSGEALLSTDLHVVVMIMITACSDVERDVRLGGLAIAAELVVTPRAIEIGTCSLGKTKVSLLANALCSSSVGIEGDAVACVNVLKEILKAPAVREEFTSYLSACVQHYMWKVARLTAPVMSALLVRDFPSVWPAIESLLHTANATEGNCRYASLLVSMIIQYFCSSPLPQHLQTGFTTKLVACITSSSATPLSLQLKEQVIKSFTTGWVKQLNDSDRELLFYALLQQQLTQSGNEIIVQALQHVMVPLPLIIRTLQDRQRMLSEALQSVAASDAVHLVENGGHEASLYVGAAQPIQQMSSYLEAVSGIIRSTTDTHLELQSLAATLMDIFSIVGDFSMRTVLEVHYLRALLLDLAHVCLSSVPKSSITGTTSKTPKKSKKTTVVAGVYTIERIGQDVDVVLRCIGSDMAMTAYGQVAALNLLKVLLTLSPQETDRAVATLSSVLSAASLDASNAKVNNFSVGIVQTVVEIRNQIGSKASPQEIVEPFMRGLGGISAAKRHQLLRIVRGIYDEGVLPTCVTTILGHTLASWDSSEKTQSSEIPTTIVLSQAAQRKAQRQMKTSLTEELFLMACSTCMKASPHNQIATLVALTSLTTCLLELTNDSTDNIVSVHMANTEAYEFDAAKYVDYVSSLSGIASGTKLHPALVLLNLQCILHIVENKTFHRALLTLFSNHDESVNNDIQKLFLQLCQHLLELLGSAAQIQQRAYHEPSLGKANIQVVISESNSYVISPVEFARQVTVNSLDIISSIQRLLDGPTFFVILQELLAHEESAVRQNALHLLSQRLQSTSERTIAYDVSCDIQYVSLNNTCRILSF